MSSRLDKYQQLYIDNSNCEFSNIIIIYHAVYLHLVIVNSHLHVCTITDECWSLLCDCGAIFLAILVLFYSYVLNSKISTWSCIHKTHTYITNNCIMHCMKGKYNHLALPKVHHYGVYSEHCKVKVASCCKREQKLLSST